MKKSLFCLFKPSMSVRKSFESRPLLGLTSYSNYSAQLEAQLQSARYSANLGDTKKAEALYKQLIEEYPKCERLYRELFNVWFEKGSVLGLKQWDIDWLQMKYRENILDCNTIQTPNDVKNKHF